MSNSGTVLIVVILCIGMASAEIVNQVVYPYVSPCEPMVDCRLQETYPECTWTLERGLVDFRRISFTCLDVPSTATLTYTITPQTDPPETHPTYSASFWSSNVTDPDFALRTMTQLQSDWIATDQAIRQTLTEAPSASPLNVDDSDNTYGALDFSNGEKTEAGLLISDTASPWTGINAHYTLLISRDPWMQIDHCLDVICTVSID